MRGDKLLKKVLPFTALSASLAMVACDSSSDTNESNDNNPAIPVDDPASSDSRNTASYDTLDSRYAIKYNVETVEDLPNCTESRDGNLAVVLDNDALYQCSAERWTKISLNPERSSSSGAVSSAAMSSVATPSSSSGKTPLTSSSSSESGNETAVSAHCFEPWHGYDYMVYQLLTGYDNGSETSGYWYSYADDADGGASAIRWPVEMDPPYFDGIDPVVDHCGGVCGTYYLSKGTLTYDPYAGVAFNIAGIDDNGDPTTADASAMGGIRVTYTSDITMALELGLGEKMERNIGYDVPFVTLAKSSVATVKEFKWSQFKQAGWGTAKITGEEAAKILASIRFKMQGKDGTQGDFNIMAIEAYNASDCNTYNHQKSSSSIAPKSSSSVMPKSSSSMRSSSSYEPRSSSAREVSKKVGSCGEFYTWQGSDGSYQVETGCITEMEDGGYWYDFNDNAEGGRSKVVWPVSPGNEYSDFAMDPIIDYCAGVCGTVDLEKGSLTYDPYAGVAFDIAGTDQDGKLVLADASGMGGICIAYTSDVPANLEISMGDIMDSIKADFDIPSVSLAKTSSGTVKEFPWSKFKQAGWGRTKITGEEMAKSLGSIRFKIQAKDGMKGKFNIMSIGPYNGRCDMTNVYVLP